MIHNRVGPVRGIKHYEACERVRTYRIGAVCSHKGCTTIVSRYNPTLFCLLHAKEAKPLLLHSRAEQGGYRNYPDFDAERRCTKCGEVKEAAAFYARRYRTGVRRETVCRSCTWRRKYEWRQERRAAGKVAS